jgi:hypothetical protein
MDDSSIQPQESSHDLKGGDRFGKEMSDYLGGITRKTIGAMLVEAPCLDVSGRRERDIMNTTGTYLSESHIRTWAGLFLGD